MIIGIWVLYSVYADDCKTELNYPEAILYDDWYDQAIAQNDLTSVELRQISNETLLVKVTVRGDPLDLRILHYLVIIDSDNNASTGRYNGGFRDLGEDFVVRIGYDNTTDNPRERWFGAIETFGEGFIADVPVLLINNSAYALVSLIPYKESYKVGNSMKYSADVVNAPEGDHIPFAAILNLSTNLTKPGFRINTENEIFNSSPHSMWLDFRERDNPYELNVSANASYEQYINNVSYFSTVNRIAEIINVSKVRTNFDIINVENNSDISYISAYIPECDLMIDPILAVSASELFKGEKAAFAMPPYAIDQNTHEVLNFSYYLEGYDVERVSSYAVDIQTMLVGRIPGDGVNRIFAYNFPACGWAGQPMYFGWGCVLQPIDGSHRPAWGIYYHEMGHVFLTHVFSSKFPGLYREDWGKYGEGWATLNGMYTIQKLLSNPIYYNLSEDMNYTLQWVKDRYRIWYVESHDNTQSVWYYENIHNNNFSKLTADTMDGMFIIIAEDRPDLNPYGWELYPRFYEVFLPKYWHLYDSVEQGYGETFFIAALSAASHSNMRQIFSAWGFPINDSYYDEIFPILDGILNPGFEFNISLDLGWNLISLPLQLGNNSVENVIKDLSGRVLVWYYNASGDTWRVYDTEEQYPRTLYNMDYGNAYWLKSTINQTLAVYGTIVKDYIIGLKIGWNFVGYNMSIGVMPEPISDLTTPILVWTYYTAEDEWKVYDTSGGLPNTLDNMSSGKGYWLKSSVEQDWKI